MIVDFPPREQVVSALKEVQLEGGRRLADDDIHIVADTIGGHFKDLRQVVQAMRGKGKATES